ncbi:MAG: hypothetical protein KC636_12990 [Myxococcales bacterium]|nr:hypothetical protein [Myxococcales bacterium]
MRRWIAPLVLLTACANAEPSSRAEPRAEEAPMISRERLGERVTVTGTPINRKGGAALDVDGEHLWIDGLHSWPDDIIARGGPLSVQGVLAEDHGLPVFVPKDDEPIVQGVPVPEGTDLKAASRRYLLRQASW